MSRILALTPNRLRVTSCRFPTTDSTSACSTLRKGLCKLAVAEQTRESASRPEGRSQLPPKSSQLLLDGGSSKGESTITVKEQKLVSDKSDRRRSIQCSGIFGLRSTSTALYYIALLQAMHSIVVTWS